MCSSVDASSVQRCSSSPVRLLLELIGSTKYAVGNVSIPLDVASALSFAIVRLPDWVFVAFAHALYELIRGQASLPSDGVVSLSSAGIPSKYTNGVDRTAHGKRSERKGSDSRCISITNGVRPILLLRRISNWIALPSAPEKPRERGY